MREPRLGPAEPMPAALSATDMGNSAVTTDAGRDRLRSAEFASVQVQQPRWRVPSRCTSGADVDGLNDHVMREVAVCRGPSAVEREDKYVRSQLSTMRMSYSLTVPLPPLPCPLHMIP